MIETRAGGHRCVSADGASVPVAAYGRRPVPGVPRGPGDRASDSASCRGIRPYARRLSLFSVNAMRSAFIPFDERRAGINDATERRPFGPKTEWLFRKAVSTSGSSGTGRRGRRVRGAECGQDFTRRPHFGVCGGRCGMFTVVDRSDPL
ncbi:hypothetical protein [Streptomyces sp. NPDC005573]|uniref:hypothetical protein n=1 Tax=Streptomyces sp. NPDC005573 TaxID=3156890 RepID=UPI0033BD9344